jgi:predicted deacetylase
MRGVVYKKKRFRVSAIILVLVLLFLSVRILAHRELDDVTPGISCEDELISKSEVLWVIPNFNNTYISDNKKWCDYILSLNKTLGMHGVTHEYEEFNTDRNQDYLEAGVKIFERCFGEKPTMFKPPHLKISEYNKELIKKNNLELKITFNQLTHKVYHCSDSDKVKNWMVDLF